jgi:Flp pilus assembly protein TadD
MIRRRFERRHLVCAGLVVLVAAVFWQNGTHPFIRFDDHELITDNVHVRAGLTWEGVRWAFTSLSGESFWHPLTWLSLMADVEMFGLDAGWHHRMGMLLHIVNTLLLFLLLRRMTGDDWKSGFVAALFAIHPLHVESVSWAAERKDTLSTLFWMLAMRAYVPYAERPGLLRYAPVLALFALGLMAKPMLVTLPFALLLIDYWPLRRVGGRFGANDGVPARCPAQAPAALFAEKIPMLLLAAISAALTVLPNRQGIWMASASDFPWSIRIANALVSYVRYAVETAWPVSLSVFYPHPGRALPLWEGVAAGLLLSAVTAWALHAARRRPWLPVGWFWYLGTLVPVIGLVQVGSQAMADHFTYVPLIGLFIVAAWLVPDLVPAFPARNRLLGACAVTALAAYAAVAWHQAGYWRSDEALFSHAIEVTRDNPVAHAGLARALMDEGRYAEAVDHLREVVRISPGYGDGAALVELADCLRRTGRSEEADRLLASSAGSPEAAGEIGLALVRQGRVADAVPFLEAAAGGSGGTPEAHYDLAVALGRLGRKEEALPHFREALRIPPENAEAINKLGVSLLRLGRDGEAEARFREALRLQPGHPEARFNLAVALERSGRRDEAIAAYREILRRDPGDADARGRLETLDAR